MRAGRRALQCVHFVPVVDSLGILYIYCVFSPTADTHCMYLYQPLIVSILLDRPWSSRWRASTPHYRSSRLGTTMTSMQYSSGEGGGCRNVTLFIGHMSLEGLPYYAIGYAHFVHFLPKKNNFFDSFQIILTTSSKARMILAHLQLIVTHAEVYGSLHY